MKKTPYSLRFSEAEARQLRDYCEAHGLPVPEENTDLKAFLMQLLQAKAAPPEAADPRSSDEYRQLDEIYRQLDEEHTRTVDAYAVEKDRAHQLHQQLGEAKLSAEGQRAQLAKAIVIAPTPEVRHLMDATCERLSERYHSSYPNGVTPQMLLLDMFIRYTRDRWSEWFYPFVLTGDEVCEILTPNTDSDESDS
jgi:hypothetical protein